MNSLVKSLIQPILEAEGQNIALVPGGFKPPTVGHFSLVDEVAKNSNIDKVIVLIGHKNRDGVSKEESQAKWDIYKKCNKIETKVVVLLPFVVPKCNFIATFGSTFYPYPRTYTPECKA